MCLKGLVTATFGSAVLFHMLRVNGRVGAIPTYIDSLPTLYIPSKLPEYTLTLGMNVSIAAEAKDDKAILSDNVLQKKLLTLKDIQEKTKAPYV